MIRVAFMGTPSFAVPPLLALLASRHEVAAVFTQPDRPSGRGMRSAPGPAKAAALAAGVPVYQFERLRSREGYNVLRDARPDLCVTAAFGQILSPRLLSVPPLGTLNVHASLLPKYRGPAPVAWCVASGEAESGATIMWTDSGVDTGDIALSRAVAIGPLETAGALEARLSELGASLLIEALDLLERGELPRVPQDKARATRHPTLSRGDGAIDWKRPAREIARRVRGFNPWPVASATWKGAPIKIWLAAESVEPSAGAPGEVLRSDAGGLRVACGEGSIEVLELQAPNARRLPAAEFLRGKPIPVGERFEVT